MTMIKNRRFELLTNEATDQLIAAAGLLHVTKSAFVTDAARQAVEKCTARSDVTMAPEVFDTMMTSLMSPLSWPSWPRCRG